MKTLLPCLLLSVASTVFAASGETETVSTGLLNRTEVKMGDDSYSAANFKLTVVVNQSSMDLFKAGDVLVGSCVGSNQTVQGASAVEGNCVIKDRAGDAYATTYSRKGTMGNPGQGTQQVRGLTGKYIGMTGSCTYDAKYAQNDGTYVVSFAKCAYQQ